MKTVESIKSILSQQVLGYQTLLDILRRERECLVHFNAAGVETLSKEKDTVILQLRLLEEERVRLVRAFSDEHKIAETVALQSISEITGDPVFQQLRLQLISLLQAVVEFNEFNRVLIERSSGVVRNALHFLGSFGLNLPSGKSGSFFSKEA